MDTRNRRWTRRCTCGNVIVREHWEDYSGATSIHGVRYLGERGRPISERIWWLLVFVGCFILNSYLIRQVWQKWNDSPVIVTFSEVTTPVWEVPFPAVTVCSLDKYDVSKYPEFKTGLLSFSDTEYKKEVSDLSLVCGESLMTEGPLTTDDNVTEFFKNMSTDMSTWTIWRNDLETKDDVLQEIVTRDGICFTFNMLDAKELYMENTGMETPDFNKTTKWWSMEKGYSKEANFDAYPYRVFNSGMRESLKLVLMTNISRFDYLCQGFTPGFKVTIHNPTHFPDVTGKHFKVQAGDDVIVGVIPDIMTTSETLKSYSPKSRQCYFPEERKLSYFKIYNQNNCYLECLTDNVISNCECVGFYMPRINKSVPICGSGSTECMSGVEWEMNNSLGQRKGATVNEDFEISECDCLPSCNSIKYKTDVSLSKMNAEKMMEAIEDDINFDMNGLVISALTIYFPEKQFTTSRRNELYGTVDFLANCGGLLSLFSGLSLLSVIEILYFATLRLWNKIHSGRKPKDDEDLENHELNAA